MRAPAENKALGPEGTKEACPYCGRTDTPCRDIPLRGFYCWRDMRFYGETLIPPLDTEPEYVKRVRARFEEGPLKKAEEAVAEAEGAYEAARGHLEGLLREEWRLSRKAEELVHGLDGLRARHPEAKEELARVRAQREAAEEALRAVEDRLQRARAHRGRVAKERDNAVCVAGLHGPGVVDRIRDAVGI